MDGRKLENRREFFIRYWVWQIKTTDCDPALPMLNYIFDRQELNIEQRYWISWLFANTYQLPTAYLMQNEFPDYENVDYERISKWNTDNFKKFRYQTDNKWNKGHLHTMFKSYHDNVGDNQHDFFTNICSSADPFENYVKLRDYVVDNFFKFGRYLVWFYLQTLKSCVGLNLDSPDLWLNGSSASHRDGLLYVLGKDEYTSASYPDGIKKEKRNIKYSKEFLQELEEEARSILEETKERFPDLPMEPDMFLMETSLCSFKKLFRKRQGRYLSYYLDRQYKDICDVELNYPGVDWDLLWDYRRECLYPELIRDPGIKQDRMEEFLDYGTLKYMDWYNY